MRTTIEQAVGGAYEMPDGRQFWVDAPVAREITRRVMSAMGERDELLEVCQAFVATLGPNGYFPDVGKPLTDRMRAAIAKATTV